jgi:quercetin dioxygenase-like cupin family protein
MTATSADMTFFDRDETPLSPPTWKMVGENVTAAHRTPPPADPNGPYIKRILFNQDGYNLHEWVLAPGAPAPPHKHNMDTVVLITEGSIKVGDREYGPGGGYFLPVGTVEAFETGPEGVRFVEFRLGAAEDVTSEPMPH